MELHTAGHSNRNILKLLGVSLESVYNFMKGCRKTGSSSAELNPGGKRSVRSKRLVDIVRQIVFRTTRRSMPMMAKDLRVSRRRIDRIVKEGLSLMSYKKGCRHFISEPSKKKRLDSTKKILQEMRCVDDKVFVKSVEKIFTVEPLVNVKNDRILGALFASKYLPG